MLLLSVYIFTTKMLAFWMVKKSSILRSMCIFFFVYLFSNSYICNFLKVFWKCVWGPCRRDNLHLRSGFGLFDVFKVVSRIVIIHSKCGNNYFLWTSAFGLPRFGAAVGSSRFLNCVNYLLHLPFHTVQGSGGSLIIAVVSSQFYTMGWQHHHTFTL